MPFPEEAAPRLPASPPSRRRQRHSSKKLLHAVGVAAANSSLAASLLKALHASRTGPVGRFLLWLSNERDTQAKRIYHPRTKEPFAPSVGDLRGLALPCHLPAKPPGLFDALRSARRRGRQMRHRRAWFVTETLMGYLNYYFLLSPKTAAEYQQHHGSWQISGEQRLRWEALRLQVSDACRLGKVSVPSRGATRVAAHIQSNLFPLAAAGSEEHLKRMVATVAKPVLASRVKMPKAAAAIAPELYLKGEQRRAFCNQQEWTLDPEPMGRPRACNLISVDEEILLRRRLLECGAAELLPVEQAPRDEQSQQVIAAGFFCVPHSDEFDRLIMDRRPLNHGERRQKWMKLPLGGMLVKIVLKPTQTVRGSGYDLSTYFTQLREHESGRTRNIVGRCFCGDDYELYGGQASQRYILSLRCIGMGDINAVDVAEETHIEILSDFGALHRPGLLRWGEEFPDERVLQGIYIDDGVVVGLVDIGDVKKEGPDSILAAKCLDALDDASAEISWHKNFGACAKEAREQGNFGEENFTAWGTQVRGREGKVATELGKRVDIAIVLLQAAALASTEKSLLEHLLSLLTHPFTHRRPCLAMLHRAHKFVKELTYGEVVEWPADIRDEVIACALCLCVSEANIRWRVSERISCTDATPSNGGATFTIVSEELSHALYRASESKGLATTLRQDLIELPDPECDPLLKDFFQCARWELSRQHAFPETQHVNLQELGEVVLETHESAAISLEPLRQINGSDSAVSIHAAAKGRSPSLLLNGELRQQTAISIFCQREQVNVKVDTHDNSADDPSRDAEVRAPREPPPEWLAPHLSPAKQLVADRLPVRVGARFRLFKEVFAGCANLSEHVQRAGISCARPMEPYPSADNRKGKIYIRVNDIMQLDVLRGLKSDIMCCYYLALHFGICCGGWGKANTMNGGTRSFAYPEGGDRGRSVLPREHLANAQARIVVDLCMLLHSLGCIFTIENPHDSFLWHSAVMLELYEFIGASGCLIEFDQCAYGLQLPGADCYTFCRKRTCIYSNDLSLKKLSRYCPGLSKTHKHDHAWGSIKIAGKRFSKAAAAGRYPNQLCHDWAECLANTISERFFHGTAPWSRH